MPVGRLRGSALVAVSLIAVAMLPTVTMGAATSGYLDRTFSADGKVLTNVAGDDAGEGVAVQADGKIVVVGSASGGTDIAVVRYGVNGGLDPTFDGDGTVVSDVSGEDVALAVAVQPDQKIVVAGVSEGSQKAVVVRYDTTGAVDATFGGGDGVAEATVGDGAFAVDIGVQSDGGIVIAGATFSARLPLAVLVARFDAAGGLDPAFGGGDGIATTPLGAGGAFGFGLAVQDDDKIVVAGASYSTNSGNVALVRYATDGTLDGTFGGGDGKVTTDVGAGPDEGHDVVLQADGKIVVVGSTGFDKAIVLRYDGAGALDPTFGGDGVVITPLDGSFEGWNGVDIRDGGIVAVGPGSPKGTLSSAGFAVARYELGGPLDSAFGGGDGLSFSVFDAGFDVASSTRASDVAVQTDGRIVVAGTTAVDGRQSDIAVTRLGPRTSAVLARPDAEVGVRGDFVGNDRYNTAGFGQIIARKIAPGRSATFQVRLGNDGNAPDFITANPRHARGVTVKYLDHGENITRQMAFGEYGDRLPPAGTTTIKAVVTVRRRTNPGTVSVVRVGASSLNDLAKLDVVAMKIVVI